MKQVIKLKKFEKLFTLHFHYNATEFKKQFKEVKFLLKLQDMMSFIQFKLETQDE